MHPSIFEAGLRGLITLGWHPRTRRAIVDPTATQERMLLAWDRVLLANISGLVRRGLAAILLGAKMGRRAGVKGSENLIS